MISNKDKIKKYILRASPIAALGVFILIWHIIALVTDSELIIPSPRVTFEKLYALILGKEFWTALSATALRSVYSFIICFAAALIIAIICYLFKPAGKFLSPIVTILRATPTMSIILISIIWFSSDLSPIFIASLIIFPLMYENFTDGLSGIGNGLVKMADTYKVPAYVRITHLYIPELLPSVFTASAQAAALNIKVIIASEVLAQTRDSVGVFMQQSRIYLDTAELIAWTVAAVALSFIFEGVIRLLRKAVLGGG